MPLTPVGKLVTFRQRLDFLRKIGLLGASRNQIADVESVTIAPLPVLSLLGTLNTSGSGSSKFPGSVELSTTWQSS